MGATCQCICGLVRAGDMAGRRLNERLAKYNYLYDNQETNGTEVKTDSVPALAEDQIPSIKSVHVDNNNSKENSHRVKLCVMIECVTDEPT